MNGFDFGSMYPIFILFALFFATIKHIVILSQMYSAIKVLEDKVKVLFELHNKMNEGIDLWKQQHGDNATIEKLRGQVEALSAQYTVGNGHKG